MNGVAKGKPHRGGSDTGGQLQQSTEVGITDGGQRHGGNQGGIAHVASGQCEAVSLVEGWLSLITDQENHANTDADNEFVNQHHNQYWYIHTLTLSFASYFTESTAGYSARPAGIV